MDNEAAGAIAQAFSNHGSRLKFLESQDPPVVLRNLAPNGGFDAWPLGNGPFTTTGAQVTPAWSLILSGITGNTASVSRDSANADFGSAYDAAITYVHIPSGYARLQQTLDQPAIYAGRTLALSVRVKSVCTARAYVSTDGGATFIYSDPSVLGGSAYETLTVVVVVPAVPGVILFGIEVTDASGVAYVDNVFLTNSDGAYEYRPIPERADALSEGYALLSEITTPITPAANSLIIYAKDAAGISTPYWKGDDGVEYAFASGGVVTGYVPYVGATSDVNLGAHDLLARNIYGTDASGLLVQAHTGAAGAYLQVQGGDANVTDGAGGSLYLVAGVNVAGTPGNSTGGDVELYAGTPTGTGTAGHLLLQAANNNAGAGGYIQFFSGYGIGGNGGDMLFQAGYASGGGNVGGNIYFAPGSGIAGATGGFFQIQTQSVGIANLRTDLLAADRIFDFPDQSGTIALLSDIPGVTGFVPYTGATSDVDLGTHTLTAGNLVTSGTLTVGGTTSVESSIRRDSATLGITTSGAMFAFRNDDATDGNAVFYRFLTKDAGASTRNVGMAGVVVTDHTAGALTSKFQWHTNVANLAPTLRAELGASTSDQSSYFLLNNIDTSVSANQVIGQIQFQTNDVSTTTNKIAAMIEAQAVNTITTDINPGRLIFYTTPVAVAAALTERMRIASTGAVTIAAPDSGVGLTISGGGYVVTGNSTLTGTLTALTGLTSSGTINFSGLTASRSVWTDGSSNLVSSPYADPATIAQGDVFYGSSTTQITALAKNTSATRYLSNTGASNNPAWAQVDLTNGVTGVLPVANGGTGASSLGAALTKTDDTNVTLTLGGSPTTALVNAASITVGWTGTLSVARGGTGVGTFTSNGVLYGNGTSAVQVTAQGAANSVLTANAGAPAFSATPTLTSLTLTATSALIFSAASGRIIPGATSLVIRNNADSTTNFQIVDAGTVTMTREASINSGGSDNETVIRRDNATTSGLTGTGILQLNNRDTTDNNYVSMRFVSVDSGGTIHNTAWIAAHVISHGASVTTSQLEFHTANASSVPGIRMTLGASGAGADITGDSSVTTTTGAGFALKRNDTAVASSDRIGRITFETNDTETTTNLIAAAIEAQATNTISTDINPGRLIFYTTPTTVAGALTERFRIDEQGSAIFSYRAQNKQGADVASANNLVLGGDGNVFEITGTTQVNLIANTNWQNGSVVTLLFTSTPTVKHNQATSGVNITIQLAGAADFVATAGDTLTLVYSEIGGTNAWREIGRAVI